MFARTAIKRYTTVKASAENHSGSSGSTLENAGAFLGGVLLMPAILTFLNYYPSTRRLTQVPMYNGTEKYNASRKH